MTDREKRLLAAALELRLAIRERGLTKSGSDEWHVAFARHSAALMALWEAADAYSAAEPE